MLKVTSLTLRKAAQIQERIEKLEGELRNLLAPKPRDRAARKTFIARRARKQAKTGGRPNGVAAGVRQILRKAGKPMKVAAIYRRLVAAGYSFRLSNPKNSLTAQMYRMRGVWRTGPGEFAVEEPQRQELGVKTRNRKSERLPSFNKSLDNHVDFGK